MSIPCHMFLACLNYVFWCILDEFYNDSYSVPVAGVVRASSGSSLFGPYLMASGCLSCSWSNSLFSAPKRSCGSRCCLLHGSKSRMSLPNICFAGDLPVVIRGVWRNIYSPDIAEALFRMPFEERLARTSFFISFTPDSATPFERSM